MKYAREIKVAVLVLICGFLLFFGLNFLKGVNIFSQDNRYIGQFENVSGLQEQAPVYVRGYKVGQVDKIIYDYTQAKAFTVTISMHKDILLTDPVEMRLVDDGLLGGKAIEVVVPVGPVAQKRIYADGDTIKAIVVPGLLKTLQEGFMAKVDDAIVNLDSLIVKINSQVDEHALKQTLDNIESVSESLVASAHEINKVTEKQLPSIVQNADTVVDEVKTMVRDIKSADIPSAIAQLDQTIDSVQTILTAKEGTLGLLLNDQALYQHVDSTVISLDKLVTDLKNNPKRYVHFSLFGGKDKAKEKTKKKAEK